MVIFDKSHTNWMTELLKFCEKLAEIPTSNTGAWPFRVYEQFKDDVITTVTEIVPFNEIK